MYIHLYFPRFSIKTRKLEIDFKANYIKHSIIVLFHINSLLWLLLIVTFCFFLYIHIEIKASLFACLIGLLFLIKTKYRKNCSDRGSE